MLEGQADKSHESLGLGRMYDLTPERAAAPRAELDRNKTISVETSIDAAVAAKFRYAKTVASRKN